MYSGTTFHNYSGNFGGSHQKINKVARRKLGEVAPLEHFPNDKLLLHFEGRNGPDGLKAKSPAQNEPWHYYDPFDPDDNELLGIINGHYKELVKELKDHDPEGAAFEAAWLSHALTDGLTPAHHYPYEEEMAQLRLGMGKETRNTIREKILAKGHTKREVLENNWKMWGVKGLVSTHFSFEMGIAAIIAPLRFNQLHLEPKELKRAKEIGLDELFKQTAREVAMMDLYDYFYKFGWNAKLAKRVREELVPTIIRTVATAWYLAMDEAGLAKGK